MKTKAITTIVITLLLASIMATAIPTHASPARIFVPRDYPTIQEAINAANPGDTVLVHRGTYDEDVDVNKDIIVRGLGYPVVYSFWISGEGAIVEGFHVVMREVVSPWDGIAVKADDVTVRNNIVEGSGPFTGWVAPTGAGISVILCDGVTVVGNRISGTTGGGIWIGSSANCIITRNHIHDTQYMAILLADFSGHGPCHDNLIAFNWVMRAGTEWNYDDGIRLGAGAYSNEVLRNFVFGCSRSGIRAVGTSHDNTIAHNIMLSNQGLGGGFDAHDLSSGSGTAGTANTWTKNVFRTSSPLGLE